MPEFTRLDLLRAALAQHEDFLRRMAHVIPGVVTIFDVEQQSIRLASRCIGALLGYSAQAFSALGPEPELALMHPADLPQFAVHQQSLRILDDHAVAEVEYRLRQHAGDWRWFHSRDAVFARDAAGAVSQIIGSALDISERKTAEEKIQRSKEVDRLTFDRSPIGMTSVDNDMRFTQVNQMFCDITGYPADELLRMTVCDLTHPDDVAVLKAQINLLLSGALDTYDVEKRYVRKGGELCWVRVTVRVVRDANGQPLHSIGVVQDINQRRQMERALLASEAFSRTVLEGIPDCAKVLDREGRLQYMNQNGQRLMEIADFAPLLGQPWISFWPAAAAAQAVAAFEKAKRGETARFAAYAPTASGVSRCWDVIVAPISPAPNHAADERLIVVTRDITESTRAQEALGVQEERYRNLFDTMLEGYCLVEVLFNNSGRAVDYRFVETNPAFEKQTGLKGAKGRRALELVPELEPSWFDLLGKIALSGEPASFQKQVQSVQRCFDVKAHRIGGPESRTVGVVFSDMTERQRVETALAQNIGLFSRMLEQAPTGMYVVDAEFRLQQVNALAAPIFETIHPLIGRDFAEIMQILWGPVVGAECTAIFRHTLASGERYVSPPFYEQRFDLGEDQAFDWETQRVTLPDGQHGVVCYFHEITARQRAQMALRDSKDRMRLATEATGVGIWQRNLVTGQLRWDDQMFRIYGMAPTADGFVNDADWRDSVHPDDLDAQEASLEETQRHLGSNSRHFRIMRRNDGECRHIDAVETVRPNALGVAEWIVGTNLDVTARKQAEARIGSLLNALQFADSRKDEFLATLAHELRNPMAAIRHSLELMRRASGNVGLMDRACATMERQMGQMVHLIDDLLDVSRITRNRLELRLAYTELASVVAHAVEASGPLCEKAGQRLTVALPPEPIALNADSMRLVQVLGNLLNNASKYTARGGHIWLSAEQQGDEVALTVKDSGIGIAPDMLHKVFELFTQVSSAMTHSQGGLGIGLSLAKRLTELHGGTLVAHSEGKDLGSAFTVRLPVLPQAAKRITPVIAVMPLTPLTPFSIASPPAPAAARRILVVDDMRDNADNLAVLLSMGGEETQTAYDGPAAVAAAAAFRPDVILLDIGMPGMNGYDACRAIRKQPWGQHIVIIALTGWGQDQDRYNSREAGFNHHLVKPVAFKDLMTLLEAHQASRAWPGAQ